jgi:hypothetical protein
MKRAVLLAVALAALVALGLTAYVRGAIPGTDGCVLRSVDKKRYLAGNDALFRTIRLPAWLRAARATTWVFPVSARNSCLPIEDEGGTPYGAYVTTYVFLRKPGGPPIGFDERILGREWVRDDHVATAGEASFRRGKGWLHVSTTSEGVLLSVDYRGYERLP